MFTTIIQTIQLIYKTNTITALWLVYNLAQFWYKFT